MLTIPNLIEQFCPLFQNFLLVQKLPMIEAVQPILYTEFFKGTGEHLLVFFFCLTITLSI
jgi:hypothetical protein